MADHEILELVLTFSLARVDTKPIAKALLKHFNGLWAVFGATEKELQHVKGVGPRAALLVSLIRETAVACLRDGLKRRNVLKSPDAVVDYARLALAGRSTESCLAIFLNARNQIIGEQVVAEGTVGRISVQPRRVIELALERKASGFIVVHNHPGGRPEPSPEDDALTRRLKSAAAAVDLRFVDHLIVARGGQYGYRSEGFLEEA